MTGAQIDLSWSESRWGMWRPGHNRAEGQFLSVQLWRRRACGRRRERRLGFARGQPAARIAEVKHNEAERRHNRVDAQNAPEPHVGGCAARGAGHDVACLILGAHAEREHGEQGHEPDADIDDDRERDFHTCSSSTRVPQKSLGCRKSTGFPCAPMRGVPSPRTRAPVDFR